MDTYYQSKLIADLREVLGARPEVGPENKATILYMLWQAEQAKAMSELPQPYNSDD